MARIAQDTAARAPGVTARIINLATDAGARAGAVQATGVVPPWVTLPRHQPLTVVKIAEDLTASLMDAAYRITRFADDAYRAATVEASALQTSQGKTPARAQEHAWARLMDQGITGFTDKAGREWTLESYAEMAVRTATARAYRDSSEERMTALGVSLFTISNTGRPCKLCLPWEGRVLAATGAGTFTENGVVFDVAATIQEAIAAGLFHPNCRHTLVAYRPGVTLLRPTEWGPAQEQAYQDTQRLRALERRVRAAKDQYDNALTPVDRARARQRIADTQAQIREHTARTGLNRRPRREQRHLGFTPNPPTTPGVPQ